jgi:bacterioferritin-associated ferredoxin
MRGSTRLAKPLEDAYSLIVALATVLKRSKLGVTSLIVCSCNVLSDHDIRACMNPGPDCPRTPAQVYRCLGCNPQCGRCARTIRAIMDQALPAIGGSSCSTCPSACGLPDGHADPAENDSRTLEFTM